MARERKEEWESDLGNELTFGMRSNAWLFLRNPLHLCTWPDRINALRLN